MIKAVTTEYLIPSNLIDFLEDLADDHGWSYERLAQDEIILDYPGSWCDYKLAFMWIGDMHTLGISASFQMRISKSAKLSIYELLARINEQLWIGHFDLSDEGMPTYRYTLLAGTSESEWHNLVEEIIQIAIGECERFFPAFQFSIWGGKNPSEAITSAMLDTEGEA
ncbi:MAG: YbjN domain-containing protein [Alphaproteobacteria bacterium]|nr:YbjN domain-containing protein [Alphaproteobacteria bacterium]